jgi:hypothetical protein
VHINLRETAAIPLPSSRVVPPERCRAHEAGHSVPLQILYNGKCCQAQKTVGLLRQQVVEVGVNSRDDKIDTGWTDVEAHACAPRLREVGEYAMPEAMLAWGQISPPRLLDVF